MNQEINRRDIWEDKKYYIYRLIDPRNNKPFFIGVGTDNKAEQHALGLLEIKDYDLVKDQEKFKSIKEIIDAGYKVKYIIEKEDLTFAEVITEVYLAINTFKEINRLCYQKENE